jgi:hypothetical protein
MRVMLRKFFSIAPNSIQYLVPLHFIFTSNMTDDMDYLDTESEHFFMKTMMVDERKYYVPFYWKESEYLKGIIRESIQKKED